MVLLAALLGKVLALQLLAIPPLFGSLNLAGC